MMNKIFVLIFISLNAFVQAQAKGASNQFDKGGDLTIEQSELIYKTIKNIHNGSFISIAIINDAKTKFIGIERKNDTLFLVELKNKAFEIGSLTKNISSFLLAELIANQTLGLNREISNVFDFEMRNKPKITFNHLASHTSGLPRLPDNVDSSNLENPYKSYSSNDLKTYLTENLELNQTEGEKWDYSNLGYGVLGFALTSHTKKNLLQLYENHIFSKLNMNQTFLDKSKTNVEIIQGLDTKGKPTSYWDFDVMAAAGGLKSTTEDLVKFVKHHFNLENAAVKMVFKERIKINENVSGTMSWLNIKNKKIYVNNGGTGGFTSSWSIQPDQKKAIIILTNISAMGFYAEPIETLNLQLLNTLK